MVKLVMEGNVFMYCTNCGSKIEENSYICVICGTLLRNRSNNIIIKQKRKSNIDSLSIVSIVLGVFSILFSIMLFFYDISSVGMYTEIYERIIYVLDYSVSAILLSTVTFIFSLIDKKNVCSNISLLLSLLSFFFIISEFIVVIIY